MSFVFYDVETTGIDTSFNQILQFAAIRTDNNLNEIDRFEIRCQLLPHMVPAPQAMLVTRVTAKHLTDTALPTHYQMIVAIREKLQSWSPAIFLGYNTLGYDEHILRQAFYQTLHPLYLTNTNGNGRSDILRLMQAASLFAPETVTIPRNDKGDHVFKLDRLAPANGFEHAHAHDALADVEATIHLCRLVKQKAPNFWISFIKFSHKPAVTKYCQTQQIYSLTDFYFNKPSSWLVCTIGVNPKKQSDVLVFDLANNPDEFVDLTAEQMAKRFKPPRPLRSIRCNASPIIMATEAAPEIAKAKALGMDELKRRAAVLKTNGALRVRLTDAYNQSKEEPEEISPHIEEQIYNSFIRPEDEETCDVFHKAVWEERLQVLHKLEDTRLRVLAHRLMYFERPDLLDEDARREHDITVARRLLHDGDDTPWLTLPKAISEVDAMLEGKKGEERQFLTEHRAYLLKRLLQAKQIMRLADKEAVA